MTFRLGARALVAAFPVLFGAPSAYAQTAAPTAAPSTDTEVGTTKRLPGGALLHLSPDARAEFGRTMKIQLGPPGSAETVTQIVKLISGRVDAEIPISKVPKTAVLFQAPHKASAVAKGGYSIAIAAADRVTFAAIDGSMVAALGNDWKTLPSGLVRSFIGNDPTPQEHAVPRAPSLNVLHPVVSALGGDGARVNVEVGGFAPAEHCEVSVWRVTDKGNEFVRRVTLQKASGEIAGLAPGQYEIKAHAVDTTGIFGAESAPRSLRVIGATLPKDARIEQGVILLGQHSRIRLIGADGMEASYGGSARFARAPASAGLSRGNAAVLRLREPGSTDEVELHLEPRTIHAEVTISPKAAHWPQDKIEVSVRLFDARGHALPETVKVKATVLVNVQPVQVNWTRTGNVLSAPIPTATNRGPWVVRVEVNDEFGDPAGRDFLEVAGGDTDRVSVR